MPCPAPTLWDDATPVSIGSLASWLYGLSTETLDSTLALSDRSGFDGPWTFSPTTFTNDYFKLLFDEKWSWRKWSGPAQFTDSQTKTLMMLPSDMSLTKDKEFKKHAKAYAQDQDLFFKE